MAKLYFRYGAMGAAKSLNLLAVAHNYRSQGKKVVLVKPWVDSRFGYGVIKSRAGLEAKADHVADLSPLPRELLFGAECVLVDEAQFLQEAFVDDLHVIARDLDIPVICYGLRTDFRTNLFPGAKRLFELADTLEEIKTICHYCNRKAIFNMRLVDGRPTREGPQVLLGAEESYLPVCKRCYYAKITAT